MATSPSITEDEASMDEIEAIISDMKKAGFPLEVIAGTQFRNKGWTARHQVFFHDNDENKSRYLDIVAHRAIDENFQQFKRLNYTVIAECKKSDKPWVFYTPPSSFLTEETDIATIAYLKIVSKPSIELRQLKSLYHNHYVSKEPLDRIAVAGYIAFSGEKDSRGYDQIYAATNQVLKALQYMMEWSEGSFKKFATMPNILIVYYPAIVFDGKMYEYLLDEKEEPKLTETRYVKYDVAFQSRSERSTSHNFLVDVVTKDFLPEYIDLLDEEMQVILKS